MQNIYLANAIKRALAIGLIKNEDLFLTDAIVLEKLMNSQDGHIQYNLEQCQTPLKKVSRPYRQEWFRPKFRGIDPLVLVGDKFVRLTELDFMFKNYYFAVQAWCNDGFIIDILQ
jgi:hypothetical protein